MLPQLDFAKWLKIAVRIKCLIFIPNAFASSVYWRGTRVQHVQLSGSECYFMLYQRLELSCFHSAVTTLPVTKAISSSSASLVELQGGITD